MCEGGRSQVSPRAPPIRADHGPSPFPSYTLGDSKRSKHSQLPGTSKTRSQANVMIGSALPSWTSDLTERKSRFRRPLKGLKAFATNRLTMERSTSAREPELELLDENWVQRS